MSRSDTPDGPMMLPTETLNLSSDLNDTQKARVTALLAGTAVESATEQAKVGGKTHMGVGLRTPGGMVTQDLGAADAAKVVARNRAMADAAELKLLLDAGDDESRKRIFVMLRRSAAANDLVASFSPRWRSCRAEWGRTRGRASWPSTTPPTGCWDSPSRARSRRRRSTTRRWTA
ncbi:MAG TPA: hypothetical protein VG265_03190 [Gaiellaceae bacterium]|nr:hypothetical protein [Gaiellaceae bacterium]